MKKLILLCLVVATTALQDVKAQIYDFGATFGVSGYVGDLQPTVNFLLLPTPSSARAGGGVWFKYNVNPYWGFRAGYLTTSIGASDANSTNQWQKDRNLSFDTYISELAVTAEFNFFKYITGHHKYNHTPFVFAGLARFRFNPTTIIDGNKVELQPLGTEGQGLDAFPESDRYSLIALSIPFGIGYRWNFYKFHSITFELSGRYALTDYLDDVSKNYAGYDLMLAERGEIAARLSDRSAELGTALREPLSQRGISTFNDAYWYAGVSYIFTINSGRCPRFR